MAIPDYQACMLPLLEYASDGEEHTLRAAVEALAKKFQLSPKEQTELLPSGQQPIFHNRVGWARTYLKKAGLLNAPRRGFFRISERGKEILTAKPNRIDVNYLERFPEFIEFRDAHRMSKGKNLKQVPLCADETPEEAIENAYQDIRGNLAQELLARVLSCSPTFFEKFVIDLLVKMGYGGSRRDAAERLGQSGDGGIDGIIKEDQLGLDTIYIQAKRWQGSEGRRFRNLSAHCRGSGREKEFSSRLHLLLLMRWTTHLE